VFLEEQLILFTVLMGIFPDFDVFLFPLANRYSWAAHHGASHSIGGVVLIAAIAAPIGWLLFSLPIHILFLLAFFAGMLHISCDIITSWSVPYLWPFKSTHYKFEIDRAVNIYLLPISGLFIITLFSLRGIGYPYDDYILITIGLSVFYSGYILTRISLKSYLKRKFGMRTMATANPFGWFLVGSKEENGIMRVKFSKYNTITSRNNDISNAEFSTERPKLPLETASEAVSHSYHHPKVQKYIGFFKYPDFAVLKETPQNTWRIAWYPIEMQLGIAAYAVIVDLNSEGVVRTKKRVIRLPLKQS
jgi:membrane-bound metal-dependent hydrolase YbcI (DUF457 family)